MLKWIPRVLLLLVVLVIATVLFAMEPIAKWAIESEGSKAVGARVTVDSVDIKLYPTHVALNGLTVANPQEPMRNLLESERIFGLRRYCRRTWSVSSVWRKIRWKHWSNRYVRRMKYCS